MPSIPSTLYTLQTLEIAVDRARERIEQIEATLAQDEAVTACQQALDTAQAELHATQTQIKDLELKIASLTEKIKEVDTLLYSGKITSPKELSDRQDELESLRRRMTGFEGELMDAITLSDSHKVQVQFTERELATAMSARDERNRTLVVEKDKLDGDIKRNLKKRKGMMESVDDAFYQTYKNLRKKKNGHAVAMIDEGGACGFCGVAQTTGVVQEIKQDTTLIYCSNCGRILVSKGN